MLPGDPIKYINWKATAKTGELKQKSFHRSFSSVVIDFTTDIDDREKRISCVAYTIVQSIKKNVPIGLKLNNTFFSPAVSGNHKTTLLTELALYGPHEQ